MSNGGSRNPKLTLKVNSLWIKMKGQNFSSQVLSRYTFRILRKKGSDFFDHRGTLIKNLCFTSVDFLFLLKYHGFCFFNLVLMFILQSRQNWESVGSAFCNPFAEFEISTRSFAYSSQFKDEPSGNNMGSVSCLSSRKGISFK